MRTSFQLLITEICLLILLAGIDEADAQTSQFFRISGPAATTITAFNTDGTLVWSNAQPGTNYTVQTLSSLGGGSNWVDYIQLPVTNGINTNQLIDLNPPAGMAFIPAGSFSMGAEPSVAGINVTVAAFYMDVNLVSMSQWQSVYNWATNNGYSFTIPGYGNGTNYPVTGVDWYDCVKWCNARSQQAGLAPVYFTDTNLTQTYTNGDPGDGGAVLPVYANWTNNGYRLPTEAEWEKAARGGLAGKRFPWGDTISESNANYDGDPYRQVYPGDTNSPYAGTSYDLGPILGSAFNNTTTPVGYFAPNGYGLYDMAGNVYEWCWDWYVESYAVGSKPYGPDEPDANGFRIERGGEADEFCFSCFCDFRGFFGPGLNAPESLGGFRCVKMR